MSSVISSCHLGMECSAYGRTGGNKSLLFPGVVQDAHRAAPFSGNIMQPYRRATIPSPPLKFKGPDIPAWCVPFSGHGRQERQAVQKAGSAPCREKSAHEKAPFREDGRGQNIRSLPAKIREPENIHGDARRPGRIRELRGLRAHSRSSGSATRGACRT